MKICEECEGKFQTQNIVTGHCELCDAWTFGNGTPDRLCSACAKATNACPMCGKSLQKIKR